MEVFIVERGDFCFGPLARPISGHVTELPCLELGDNRIVGLGRIVIANEVEIVTRNQEIDFAGHGEFPFNVGRKVTGNTVSENATGIQTK